jgi:hypothetical protein
MEPMEHVHRSLLIIDHLLGSKKVSGVQTSPRFPRVATLLRGLPLLSVANFRPLKPGRPFRTLFMSPSEITALRQTAGAVAQTSIYHPHRNTKTALDRQSDSADASAELI